MYTSRDGITKPARRQERENISNFLRACRSLGVQDRRVAVRVTGQHWSTSYMFAAFSKDVYPAWRASGLNSSADVEMGHRVPSARSIRVGFRVG